MTKNVDAWFDNLSADQQPVLTRLRRLILDTGTGFTESLKWGQPCYSLIGLVCYLQKAKTHVALGFQQGAHLPDPRKMLTGTGKDMRHVKFSFDKEIDIPACRALIEEAVTYDSARSGT